jgi:hypothetical protein
MPEVENLDLNPRRIRAASAVCCAASILGAEGGGYLAAARRVRVTENPGNRDPDVAIVIQTTTRLEVDSSPPPIADRDHWRHIETGVDRGPATTALGSTPNSDDRPAQATRFLTDRGRAPKPAKVAAGRSGGGRSRRRGVHGVHGERPNVIWEHTWNTRFSRPELDIVPRQRDTH